MLPNSPTAMGKCRVNLARFHHLVHGNRRLLVGMHVHYFDLVESRLNIRLAATVLICKHGNRRDSRET